MRIGSLFSGAGGLDMAVQAVFGGDIVWHSEIDKAASKVLAYRFPGVPNLGSVTEIDWATVEPVDVLCGGFPCTDVSLAGKRAGMHGTRSGLWSHMAEAIDVLRPRFVVIENVRGLLNANANRPVEPGQDDLGNGTDGLVLRAIGAVLGDISDIGGYEARWITVAAADVGAPHRRERVFIVATDTRSGRWDSGVTRASFPCGSSGGLANGGFPFEPACTECGHDSHDHVQRRDSTPCTVCGCGDYGWHDVGVALLPTPVVTDAMGARNSTAWRSNPDHGISIGDTLTDAMWKLAADRGEMELPTGPTRGSGDEPGVALLPTPRSSDCFGAGQHGDGGMDLRTTVTLLPTPSCGDAEGGGKRNNVSLEHTQATDGSGKRGARYLKESAMLVAESQWGKYAPAITRWEAVVGPAPAPTEPNKNGNPRLSAAFSEWLMGWPAGWVTDPAIGISRNDQLRILGNGVVPAQAARALRFLLAVAND